MWIIDLTPLAPGVYNDHRADHITAPPDGWAMIPDDFPVPSTYPRLGSIEAEEKTYPREVEVTKKREVPVLDDEGNPVLDMDGNPVTTTEEYMDKEIVPYTMMTVTAMTEGTLPEPVEDEKPTAELTVWDELDAAYLEGVNGAYG